MAKFLLTIFLCNLFTGNLVRCSKPLQFPLSDSSAPSLIKFTMHEIKRLSHNLHQLNSSTKDKRLHSSIGDCIELINHSSKLLNQSYYALKNPREGSIEDIETWLSGVITFQSTCEDYLKHLVDDTNSSLLVKINYTKQVSLESLAMVSQTKSPSTVFSTMSDFPSWVSSKDRKLLQSNDIKPNVVVAQDGSGDYRTISAAIEAAGEENNRHVIYVKAGIYHEKIRSSREGLVLIGDGKYSTIISRNESILSNIGTMQHTATVGIHGAWFMARDIGFENTAGPSSGRALALIVHGDKAVLYRCLIRSYHDTLYAHSQRQFYKECDIYGTVDFIFGFAAAVFQSCNIILRRPANGEANVIMAQGRDVGNYYKSGFVVQNCTIMPDVDLAPIKSRVSSYLGRPWRKYSMVVFMQSHIADIIDPQGWTEYRGDFALSTLYFGEYLNVGPGANTSKRVRWPGFHIMNRKEASRFSVENFI